MDYTAAGSLNSDFERIDSKDWTVGIVSDRQLMNYAHDSQYYVYFPSHQYCIRLHFDVLCLESACLFESSQMLVLYLHLSHSYICFAIECSRFHIILFIIFLLGRNQISVVHCSLYQQVAYQVHYLLRLHNLADLLVFLCHFDCLLNRIN